ncbi:hypothetical protein [Paenibacillus gallinarum]|uniref:DUF5067 domain-containing protein n=1 Tax=Paenibacillus gallinarum TaxID=2762232 RepID=A0ABR8T0T4_9BACL|nr:hypothetical protein [Paenibacillus gallinarum]MBD7969297.1 hypothetical protein [Paenibacillus gallinarum]
MSRKFTLLSLGFLSFLLILFIMGCFLISYSTPLKSYGMSNNDEHTTIYFEITNEGRSALKLMEVKVNDNLEPSHVELGISYNGRLVTAGFENEKRTKLVGINEELIHPELLRDQTLALIQDDENQIPIHYGIRIINNKTIQNVTIKYKYYGMTKVANFELEPSLGRY